MFVLTANSMLYEIDNSAFTIIRALRLENVGIL